MNTVQQLRAGLDFYRLLAPGHHRDWRYPTFAHLVLVHGRLYAPAPWPGGPQRPGQCFAAAHALADREGWTYCEGFALVLSSAGPVPHGAAEHAWCLTDDGRVADPALPDGHAALYWGLPLAEAFRAEHRRARGDDAVLTYGTDPFRAQLNEVLRTELPATALAPVPPPPRRPAGRREHARDRRSIHPEGALGEVEILWHRPADPDACDGDCDYHPVACGEPGISVPGGITDVTEDLTEPGQRWCTACLTGQGPAAPHGAMAMTSTSRVSAGAHPATSDQPPVVIRDERAAMPRTAAQEIKSIRVHGGRVDHTAREERPGRWRMAYAACRLTPATSTAPCAASHAVECRYSQLLSRCPPCAAQARMIR